MADNFTSNPGSGGDTFAADDIGGIKYPRVKLIWGVDGTNSGDVSNSAPLPVADGGGSLTVDGTVAVSSVGGTVAVTQSGTWDEIGINDSGNSITVDAPQGTPVFVRLSDGTNPIATLPVSLASAPSTAVTNAGTFAVQESGTQVVTDDAAFTPGTTKVVMAGFEADESSTDSVDEGDGGAARMTLDRKQIVTVQPHTAGGLTVTRNLDVDESEDDVKTSPGCLYKIRITNRTTSVRYVKLYNDTAANVTVGSTTPLDTIPIPANASDYTVLTEDFGGLGLTFSAALSIAATTGFADNDTGAPGTNDIIASLYYK